MTETNWYNLRRGATKESTCPDAYCHIHGVAGDNSTSPCSIWFHPKGQCGICDKERTNAKRGVSLIQTRDESGALRFFRRLDSALSYAEVTPSVWKVSFTSATGERVRLVRTKEGWVMENITGYRFI